MLSSVNLFNLYSEQITSKARLDELQAGIRQAGETSQQPQICRGYHSNSRKQRGAKELFDEGEGGE